MKKFLLSLVAILSALSMSAKEDVITEATVFQFANGWAWNTVKGYSEGLVSDADAQTVDLSNVVYTDMSAFDYLVVEYTATTDINLIIQYNCTGVYGQYGPEFNTGSATCYSSPSDTYAALKLSDLKNTVNCVALQNSATTGTMNVSAMYFATAEEYEAVKAKYEAAETGATEDLSLTDLGSGWQSSYDATTQTITFEGDWTGRGWWLGGKDGSRFTKVTVEIEPVDWQLKLVVEYGSDSKTGTSEVMVAAGSSKLQLYLDDAYKAQIMQVYIQTSKAGAVKINKAYFSSDAAPSVITEDLSGAGEITVAGGDFGWNNGTWLGKSSLNPKFKNIVFEIEYTEKPISIVVQYPGDDYNVNQICAATTKACKMVFPIPDDATGINQWAIQNFNKDVTGNIAAGDFKCKITKVYLTSEDVESDYPEWVDPSVAKAPLYVVGDVEGASWSDFSQSTATLEYNNNVAQYVGVITVADSWNGDGWFAVTPTLGTAEELAANDWTNFNAARLSVSADYGTLNETATLVQGADASFKLAAGTYTLYVDLTAMTIKIESGNTGIKSAATTAAKSGKFVENNTIVIYKNGKKFNVAGVSVK